MAQTPSPYGPGPSSQHTHMPFSLSQQQTLQQPAFSPPTHLLPDDSQTPTQSSRPRYMRIVAPLVVLILGGLLYFVWNTSNTSSGPITTTQQSFNNTTSLNHATSSSSTTNGSDMQIYIVGAVKHPGVYTLSAGARVYQLLQAAGGPLTNANLVALNLAAKLSDGQEVYVTLIGETPPTYVGGVPAPGNGTGNSSNGSTVSGQLININTSTVDELRQGLHVSSVTAQNIVNYRQQHGNFTSLEQLLQVVSKSIYDKIKGLVTV